MVGKARSTAVGPMGFILGFSIVSMLGNIVCEAALSVQGPLPYSLVLRWRPACCSWRRAVRGDGRDGVLFGFDRQRKRS